MNSCWTSEDGASAPRASARRGAPIVRRCLRLRSAPAQHRPTPGTSPPPPSAGCALPLSWDAAGRITPSVRLFLPSGANAGGRLRDRGRASVGARISAGTGDARASGRRLEGWAGDARASASEGAVGSGQGERRGEKRARASGREESVRGEDARASARRWPVRAGAGRALGAESDARASGARRGELRRGGAVAGARRGDATGARGRWNAKLPRWVWGSACVGARRRGACVGARSEARAPGREVTVRAGDARAWG
jgi:hypothetical protein